MALEKRISSVDSYISHVMELKTAVLKKGETSKTWFFRGQKSVSWPVTPQLFRNDLLSAETDITLAALRSNPTEFKECACHFEKLTKLQHYNLGTRLLDVTLNPLVALYFACEESKEYIQGKDSRFKCEENDGCVYYQYTYGSPTSDLSVQIASRLPFMYLSDDTTLDAFCNMLLEEKIIDSSKLDLWKSEDYRFLTNSIQVNHFVLPDNSNARLRQQSGAFVIPSMVNIIAVDSKANGQCVVKKAYSDLRTEFDDRIIRIPAKDKEKILKELDFLNINESTLFPELEHQMKYIMRRTNVEVGIVPQFIYYEENDTSVISKNGYNNTQEPMDKKGIADALTIVRRTMKQVLPQMDSPKKTQLEETLLDTIKTIDWQNRTSLQDQTISKLTLSLPFDKEQNRTYANNLIETMKLFVEKLNEYRQ